VGGAAVPAAVCRWGLFPCCPDVGRYLSGVYNYHRLYMPYARKGLQSRMTQWRKKEVDSRAHYICHRRGRRIVQALALSPLFLSLPPCAGGWRLASSMLRRAHQRERKTGRERGGELPSREAQRLNPPPLPLRSRLAGMLIRRGRGCSRR